MGPNNNDLNYGTASGSVTSGIVQDLYSTQENISDYRNLRLQNPIFKYDFKLGNYMSEETKRKVPHLFTTIHDLTTGLRKPFWSNSPEILKFIQGDLASYLTHFSTLGENPQFFKNFTKFSAQINGPDAGQDSFWANLTYSAGFYNPYFLASEMGYFGNNR